MIKYVLFDLDGTLTDSAPGICNSVSYSLEKFGIREAPEKLRAFVGPPLLDSYARFYGFSPEQARQGVVWYREYYVGRGMLENEVYGGIRELLEELVSHGIRVILATSKPEEFACRILEHFDLLHYFFCVGGASMDESRTDKAEVIAYVLEKAGIGEEDKEKTVMVGDREHDIIGAHKNGLRAVGVLYGYGSEEELKQAGADEIARDVWTAGEGHPSLQQILLR